MIQTFIANSASYLPLMENISYLIDLMEHCYNIGGLVEFLVQVSIRDKITYQYVFSPLRWALVFAVHVCLKCTVAGRAAGRAREAAGARLAPAGALHHQHVPLHRVGAATLPRLPARHGRAHVTSL